MTWRHLARRFAGSLRPGGPGPADERWARAALVPGEAVLWSRMSGPDRRHAVGVARSVQARLGPEASRPVLAAALLHDVGKLDAGLGTLGRSAATVVAIVRGPAVVRSWRRRPGIVGRAGRYLCHDEIGAELLTAAGSDPLTVSWAREHHHPRDRWTVPARLSTALKAADDG